MNEHPKNQNDENEYRKSKTNNRDSCCKNDSVSKTFIFLDFRFVNQN